MPSSNQMINQFPDIVQRAEAILQSNQQGGAPRAAGVPAIPGIAGMPGVPGLPGITSLPELQQRALALVNDVFASLGALSSTMSPTMAPAMSPMMSPNLTAGGLAAPASLPGPSLPWQLPVAVAAGQPALLPLAALNSGARPQDVSFFSTDLLSDTGRSIAAHQISFDPPRLQLAPGERGNVTARIEVPLQAAPGAYSGLVQAAGLPASKSVITIQVT